MKKIDRSLSVVYMNMPITSDILRRFQAGKRRASCYRSVSMKIASSSAVVVG